MAKRLDNMCRLTIPKSIRERYNITPGTEFDIFDRGTSIELIPSNKVYVITKEQLYVLRKLYNMLDENNLLDEYYDKILADITKRSLNKCETCGSHLFYEDNGTYKCYKCE